MNIGNAVQSGMIGLNRNYDNSQRTSAENSSGQVVDPELQSGKTSEAVKQVAETTQASESGSASTAGVEATRVVTAAGGLTEPGASLGSLVDVLA